METGINKYIVKTQLTEWKPLIEEGVNTKGITLRYFAMTIDKSDRQVLY